jgi:transposase
MIAVPAMIPVYVVHEPVSFGRGIDGMRGLCLQILKKDPIERGYFLFINRRRNQVRALWYDGQGFVLATKRLSMGRFQNWPKLGESCFSTLEHFQAHGLLSDGFHHENCFHPVWKKSQG